MKDPKHIALVGDYNPDVTAHVAIPQALAIASSVLDCELQPQWVDTQRLDKEPNLVLSEYAGVWCVPASPYASMQGAINAIQYARDKHLPFLGTCGGYQHAVLEFARNALGHAQADNAEVNTQASMPLIASLSCALVEESDNIKLKSDSHLATIYASDRVKEQYRCSYGVNPSYVDLFDNSALNFVGFDDNGEPRAFELNGHPFFVGVAYQPERSALLQQNHPLISAFVSAIAGKLSLVA